MWGHQVAHITQAQIESIEKRGANASGIFEAGRCRTLTLIVSYGPRGHPVARVLKELFSEWFKAVRSMAKLGDTAFNNLRAAWGRARANLADKYSARIQHCKVHTVKPSYGIMHNVITWLYKLGWNPMSVDRWCSPNGDEYLMSDLNFPAHLIIFDIVDSYNAIKLKHASGHRNGKGIETAIDYSSTFCLMATKKVTNNYPQKAALETVMAAAIWPNQRVHDAYPEVSSFAQGVG